MASHALLLSNDPHSSSVFKLVLEELDLRADLCASPQNARQLLRERHYESVIVDCDSMADTLSVISELKHDDNNRRAVTVTLAGDAAQMKAATESGATFVLPKPVPAEDARRVMRISRQMLSRDAIRQSLRIVFPQLAYALLDDEKQIMVENISGGGMAVQAEEVLLVGGRCRVRFTLPNDRTVIASEADIVWSDLSGRAGLRFAALDPALREYLGNWVEGQCAAGVPDADGKRRVVLDMPAQLVQPGRTPGRWMTIAVIALVDGVAAIAATVSFALMVWIFSGQLVSLSNAILVGLLFCAVYHYLFVAHKQRTFGARVIQRWKAMHLPSR